MLQHASGDRLTTASTRRLPALIEQLLRARDAQELHQVAALFASRSRTLDPESRASLARWADGLVEARRAQIEQRDQAAANLARLEGAERLQRALYAIAEQAGAERRLPEVMSSMHEILRNLMYAENCYFVLYDESSDTVRFVYYADVADPADATMGAGVALAGLGAGETEDALFRLAAVPVEIDLLVRTGAGAEPPPLADLLVHQHDPVLPPLVDGPGGA